MLISWSLWRSSSTLFSYCLTISWRRYSVLRWSICTFFRRSSVSHTYCSTDYLSLFAACNSRYLSARSAFITKSKLEWLSISAQTSLPRSCFVFASSKERRCSFVLYYRFSYISIYFSFRSLIAVCCKVRLFFYSFIYALSVATITVLLCWSFWNFSLSLSVVS